MFVREYLQCYLRKRPIPLHRCLRILLDILEHEAGYRNFTEKAMTDDDYEGLVRTVATVGEWAGDASVYAAFRILHRPVHVYAEFPNAPVNDEEFMTYMRDPGNRNHRRYLYSDDESKNCPVSIHYRGNHFVALLPTNQTDFPCGSDNYVLLRHFGLP